MCNPVQGSAARQYYLDTIAGLGEFCDGFAEVAPEIEPIREYIESNEVAGVTAVDDQTVQFTLTQPASDFVYLLALFRFVAPQPVEYLDYLADSPDLRQNIIENGPYQVVEYVPDQSYVLERNPNWDPETDDLRDSPAMVIARAVRAQGAIVRAFDPVASEKAQDLDLDLDVYPDAYVAAAGADVIALLTEWDEFRWLDFERVRENMSRPSIVDARNLLDPAAMRRLGFAYAGVGRR